MTSQKDDKLPDSRPVPEESAPEEECTSVTSHTVPTSEEAIHTTTVRHDHLPSRLEQQIQEMEKCLQKKLKIITKQEQGLC